MRTLAALVLLLAACAADPVLAPRDCTPGTTSSCACPGASGVQTCTAAGTVGACVCPDAGADVVAVGDAPDVPGVDVAVIDAGADVVAVADVVDAGASTRDAVVGPDVADAGVCPNGRTAICDGMMVSLVNGVRDDAGIRHHCGSCGVSCAPGEGCVSCRCER